MFNRLTVRTVCVVATLILAAGFSHAHDYASPEDAVNTYIRAVKTGSGDLVKMAFIQSASIQYFDTDGNYQNYTRDAFAELVNTGNTWGATIEITDLKRTGNAANATVEFTWGDNKQHGYVDYLNLINEGGSWHITDKVAQYVER
jgi:hypothetical protein